MPPEPAAQYGPAHRGPAPAAPPSADARPLQEPHSAQHRQQSPPADGQSDTGGAGDDTMDLYLPEELNALLAEREAADGPDSGAEVDAGGLTRLTEPDLLDSVGSWPAATTAVGSLRLEPVVLQRDLRLITAWMNDPAVAAFWELEGPAERTEEHVRVQLEGDGRSVPALGVLDGRPVSYWEVYRADLDPLARYYRARPHDTGLHVLVGGVADRGRGVGSALLRGVAELVLDQRPSCGRVLAEPDLRNIPSVAAFLSAGFRFSAEVDLPDKRAALMVRDRELRCAL